MRSRRRSKAQKPEGEAVFVGTDPGKQRRQHPVDGCFLCFLLILEVKSAKIENRLQKKK